MVDQAAHVGHHSHVAGNTSLKVLSSKLLKRGNLLHGTRANATTRAGIKLKIRPGHIRGSGMQYPDCTVISVGLICDALNIPVDSWGKALLLRCTAGVDATRLGHVVGGEERRHGNNQGFAKHHNPQGSRA